MTNPETMRVLIQKVRSYCRESNIFDRQGFRYVRYDDVRIAALGMATDGMNGNVSRRSSLLGCALKDLIILMMVHNPPNLDAQLERVADYAAPMYPDKDEACMEFLQGAVRLDTAIKEREAEGLGDPCRPIRSTLLALLSYAVWTDSDAVADATKEIDRLRRCETKRIVH